MDCINRLLNFLSRSSYLNLFLTITLLILRTVLPKILLFSPDPFFLSVIPHSLDTFKFQSANWNVMIPSISGRGQTVSSPLFLHYKYLALSLNAGANGVLKILTLTFIYVTTTPFYTLLYGLHVNRKSYETLWENALRVLTFLRVHPL